MVWRILYIILGSFIHAVAINAFYMPHNLLSGGVTGVAMLLEYKYGIPTGITSILLNIPLFIAGYKYVSRRFTYFSILGTVSSSIFLLITQGWIVDIQDTMVSCLIGGLLSGIGIGLVIKNRGSLGGTDILSVIVNKYFSFSIGTTTMAINAIILTLAAMQFGIERAAYTLVALYVCNKALDNIQEGFNHKKSIIIISDNADEVAKAIFKKIKRGITFLNGEGGYTGKQKKIIYIVLRTTELSRVRDTVRQVDPAAFITIVDAREVEGKGFDGPPLF
ncbi:MAG: YitT family protein [Xylanivirga thermophila]|uniref:YitT family protein n=1 Tax=Xylanivirga thermophila TaxID=2496273 RepID=UPI00101C9C49|nr:YitT family protein [Xylanivirga thermophila]